MARRQKDREERRTDPAGPKAIQEDEGPTKSALDSIDDADPDDDEDEDTVTEVGDDEEYDELDEDEDEDTLAEPHSDEKPDAPTEELQLGVRPMPDGVPKGPFRSGYVAIVGRPNVGKSTLLNKLLGQKIAATTHKPQTTRKNLLGILQFEGAEMLLLDTPGYHRAKGPLNRFMVDQSKSAMDEADVVVYMVEAREGGAVSPGNEAMIAELKRREKPVILALNKVDRLKSKDRLLPMIEEYRKLFEPAAVVPISAMYKSGLDRLTSEILQRLPEGPRYYDPEQITDQSERAIVAELIREKVMLETREELPYSATVTIDLFEDDRPRIVKIKATVHIERDSQKKIVIGKGGERIKAIGTRARKEIEYFVGTKVFLELFVRVTSGWTERADLVSEFLEMPEDARR